MTETTEHQSNQVMHTPGPWRWELNEQSKHLHLVGGKPQFDLTILEPVRWGMGNATLMIRDTAFDGMNIMHKLHERRDWISPFPGREHHAHWLTGVTHPDMRLIEAAPDLLAACKRLLVEVRWEAMRSDVITDEARADIALAEAAIRKATAQE